MRISISRRGVIVAASLAGIAVWAASSQAAPLSFKVALTGAQQVPPVQTTATGTADLTYDPATRMLTWSVTSIGLSGPATIGAFPRTGGGRQECSPGDLAEREGGAGP